MKKQYISPAVEAIKVTPLLLANSQVNLAVDIVTNNNTDLELGEDDGEEVIRSRQTTSWDDDEEE